MVRSRFYIGAFCAAVILATAPVFRAMEVAATAVFDALLRVFDDVTAASFTLAAMLRETLSPEAGDSRLLPALRSHGGVGLDHQHTINGGNDVLLAG